MSRIGKPALRCPHCPALFTHPDTLLVHAVKLHRTEAAVISTEQGESTSARLRRVEAELASARAELEELRYSGWIVARDGGRACTACEREIRRGEAYTVNTSGDELNHVHCPNVKDDHE